MVYYLFIIHLFMCFILKWASLMLFIYVVIFVEYFFCVRIIITILRSNSQKVPTYHNKKKKSSLYAYDYYTQYIGNIFLHMSILMYRICAAIRLVKKNIS